MRGYHVVDGGNQIKDECQKSPTIKHRSADRSIECQRELQAVTEKRLIFMVKRLAVGGFVIDLLEQDVHATVYPDSRDF
ncbi:Brd4-Interacting Chromatin-Remodeling Complex-Associated Protein-Like [Manis pentadactyla]|nr:Brd4-Interacting Chromatin-Remodeling Complex-Associated Protein-Like [Manis pentadactyla]